MYYNYIKFKFINSFKCKYRINKYLSLNINSVLACFVGHCYFLILRQILLQRAVFDLNRKNKLN